MGVKLFSGGPYADRQLGDSAINAAKPLQQAGQNFLGYSQGQGQGAIPSLFNQAAYESGIQSPFGGVSTAGNTNGKNVQQQPAAPGELSGSYLDQFNNLKGHVEKARNSALSQLRSHLAARGLADSSEARAHEDYLNSQFDNHLSDQMSNLQSTQHNERLSSLNNFIQQMQGMAGTGGGLITGNVNTLQNQAQAAEQRTNNANAQVGSILGMAAGGFGGNPFKGGGGGLGGYGVGSGLAGTMGGVMGGFGGVGVPNNPYQLGNANWSF